MDDGHPYVPDSTLRRKMGWDARHDAMAAQIVKEFSLKLPRDRELVRQLAFIRIQQGQRVYEPEPDSGLTFDKEKGIGIKESKDDKP